MNVSENTELYRTYGAHPAGEGWSFRVYAPSAREAALAGDFNHWQPVPMERQGSGWVLTVSDARPGDCYKYVITGADGQVRWKADPYGTYAQLLLDEVAVSDKTYILVAHNGIARVVQSYFYEMTNEEYAAFGVANCAVVRYEF